VIMSQRMTTAKSKSQLSSDDRSVTTRFKDSVQVSKERLGRECAERPLVSVLVALGAGLSIGLLLGRYLSAPADSNGIWQRRRMDGLRRRIVEAVANALPDSIAERISSNPD
jgi:hypothetical protein